MSKLRPYCLWVTPSPGMRGSSSYALTPRYGTIEAARRALAREYPTGRTALGATVAAGHEAGGAE